MLQKLHKTKESEDLAEAEKSFCQQLMSLHDYGYFFYTGRQSKKQDSEPVLFAVHATGVYFFEISKNVYTMESAAGEVTGLPSLITHDCYP